MITLKKNGKMQYRNQFEKDSNAFGPRMALFLK